MQVSFDVDGRSEKINAIYVKVSDAKIARTVEVAPCQCYVDLDKNGEVVGVEMLEPGKMQVLVKQVAEQYKKPSVSRALDGVRELLAV